MSDKPKNEAQVAISALYDAALTPQLWPQALHKLSDMVNAASAHYMLLDSRRGGSPVFGACFNRTPECIHLHPPRASENAPCPARSPQEPTETKEACHRLFVRHDIDQPSLYREHRRQGDQALFLGTRWESIGPLRASIYLRRLADMPPFGRDEEQLLAELDPHLQRATQIHLRAQEITSHTHLLEDLANTLTSAMFLVDRNSIVHFNNRAATSLLNDTQSPLHVDHERLVARALSNTKMLASHIHMAADHGIGNALRLPGPSSNGAPTVSYNVLICPLPSGPASAHAACAPLVTVQVSTAQPSARIHAHTLRALFGLTEAEANLGLALLQGQQLDEYSQARGVSVTTLRSQVRQLLAKTGTRRQAELVSLLAAVPTVGARMRPRGLSKRNSI